MEIMWSIAYNAVDIKQCIETLHKKSTPVEKIITHHYIVDDIDKAFKQAAKSNETLKILIDHELWRNPKGFLLGMILAIAGSIKLNSLCTLLNFSASHLLKQQLLIINSRYLKQKR